MKTLGQRMRDAGGRTSGFDYLRLALALGVMLWHGAGVSYGIKETEAISSTWVGIPVFMLVPFFFALSGFLVTGSLLRARSHMAYLGLRALRILPALIGEIILSAFLLGPLLTTVDLKTYFSDPQVFAYFLNVFGWVHYILPGVYPDNPIPYVVNSSLWTIPFEMECYIALFILALAGIAGRKKLIIGGFTLFSAVALAYSSYHPAPVGTNADGHQLMLYFLGGVMLYLNRDRIPHSPALCVAAAVFCVLLVKMQILTWLTPLPLAYVTVYLGLLDPRKAPLLFSGDYSYGIYLYAFPIQQAVTLLFPEAHVWYLNFAMALAPVGVFAALSWHFAEKPLQKLKRGLTRRRRNLTDPAAETG